MDWICRACWNASGKFIRHDVGMSHKVGSVFIHASKVSSQPRWIYSLRRAKYNLNAIAHDTTIALIRNVLDKGVNLKEVLLSPLTPPVTWQVYVDTVGSPEKYQAKLSDLFPKLKIKVEKKADAKYAVVSAASICAKVSRDDIVKGWKFTEEALNDRPVDLDEEDTISPLRNFGSGYPGDPTTLKWLANNVDRIFGFPSIIRFSWSTSANFLEKNAVSVRFPCDIEAEEDGKQQKMTSFLKRKKEDDEESGDDKENDTKLRSKLMMSKYGGVVPVSSLPCFS